MDQSEVKHLAPAVLTDEQKCLLKAADLIEEHGHQKGCYGDAGIGHCVLGALHWAVGVQHPDTVQDHPIVSLAIRNYLAPAINEHAASWNDDPFRTKEEVVAKLRAVAFSGPTS
jgi:hypothetical protein